MMRRAQYPSLTKGTKHEPNADVNQPMEMLMASIDRRFRLSDTLESLGLSCAADGAWLAGVPLLRMSVAGLAPRPADEIGTLAKAAYGRDFDASRLPDGLDVVADALNRGDLGRATWRR